jgi:hypothetical protein
MADTKPTSPDRQREEILDSQRKAHRDEPRNFREDALRDKIVHVEPDGTGPTSTGTFDAPRDERQGSGNDSTSR